MARLHNTVPALLLVLLGAWAGTGRDLGAALAKPAVWLMAIISAGVSAASMVINDYFDWRSGADALNAPDKPLPSGLVQPDVTVLLAGAMYVAVLIAACTMEHPAIRGIVAFSAAATLLYTPLLKRMTLVKNAAVGCVIALAPLTGALAAGASGAVLQRLAVPCAFAWAAIVFREVLMDCADVEGDAAASVRTLPVLLGPGRALAVGSAFLVAAAGSALAALHGPVFAALHVLTSAAALAAHWPVVLCTAGLLACLGQLAALVVHVYSSGFQHEVISAAVDGSMAPLGLAIILLAALA